MDLRLTVVTDQVLDLAVTAPEGARWRDVLVELRSLGLVHDAGPAWYAGAAPVAADAVLGQEPLLDGAVVSTRPAGQPALAVIPSAATTSDGRGHLLVNRQPRQVTTPVPPVIRLPPEPRGPDRQRLPLLAMTVPLLLAVPMAWVQHSPAYLLFGLMSPAMLLGSLVSDRRGSRLEHRRARADWRRELEVARAAVTEAVAAERAERRRALPDSAELLRTVRGREGRLWERRIGDPDALLLRIGTGGRPARVRVVTAESTTSEHHPMVDQVPIGIDLPAVGAFGVAGPRSAALGLVRALVAQVAGWHSPREARLVLLARDGRALEDWRWASLLPHCRAETAGSAYSSVGSLDRPDQVRQRVAELVDLLTERRSGARDSVGAGPARAWGGPAVVLVLDGARRLRSVPGVSRLLDDGPMVGIFSICLDTSRAALPVECRAFVELPAPGPDGGRTAVVSEPAGPPAPIVADGVGPDWLERFARSVAPLRDATPDDRVVTLPDACRLLDLLGEGAIEPDRLVATWSADPPSTTAVIGANPDGPHTVDLRHDGPHALVAGTTGAGKSELLQTVVASLALASSPADLSFVLVDYKGGSAFDHCAQLPHTVGLVTDLDPHLAERALTSLTAELKRREVVLREAGAKDIDDYIHRRPRSTPGPAQPRLGRLVLVIDEFRMIAEELPEFLDGIVRIAALGRSLGVHLILATQRPAGIVTADIAANVNLRIALRVRDQVDSDDVIEARDAAAISARTPGRAYARAGANPLVLFQTARVAGSGAAAQESGCAVRLLGVDDLGELRSTSALVEPDPVPTDLARIVVATRAAAKRLDLPPVRRPWLPPLPELLTVDQLDAGPEPWAAPYAAVDRPERQTQQTLAWDLAGEAHLAVVGTMRSGRSTLLRTLAGSIAQRFGPDDVHLHVIDGGAGGLLPVGRLPHAGVVCPVDPPTRSVRLLDRLAEEVRRRRTLLAAGGFGSVVEHRAGVEPGHRLPFLVVLIDGWEGVSAAWEGVEHGRPVDLLQQLLRDGPGVGLLVALAGDRSLLLSRMSSLVRDKIVLRLADPTDLVLAGIPAAAVPGHLPAGRGVRLVDHAEVQVALLDPDPRGQAQIAALDRIVARSSIGARSVEERASHRPIRIQPLPRRIAVSDLEPAAGLRAPGWALVGAGGDAAEPVGLMVLGSSALVAGPPRSGRSTTLRTMAGWLGRQGTAVVAVTSGASALAGLAGSVGILDVVDAVDSVAVRRLRTLLASGPDLCVVVDDVEHLLDTEAEEVVLHWCKSPTRGAGSLLVAGHAADLSGLFRGLSVVARRSGQGVLLHPSSYPDGDLLGVRLSGAEVTERLPGRGLLVSEEQTQEVQTAWEPDRPGQNDGRADPGPNTS